MQIETEMAALRRLACALTSDADAADDLVQDTLLAAIRHPPDESTSVRPWLATVLRRRRISLLRSAHREASRLAALPERESTRSPEAAQVMRELAEEVASLSDDDQRLLELRFGNGCSAAECAARLGREASTVRTQLSRTLQRLRTRLDRRDGGRQSWMPALVALGQGGDRYVALPLAIGPSSLGLGAVFAATTLWLGAAMPNGCGSTIDTASAEPSARSQPDDAPAGQATRASAPANHGWSAALPFAMGGPDPDDDDDVTKWGAAPEQENAEGAVHPLLALSMGMRGMYARTGRCRTSGGTGSARVSLTVRFDPDGSTVFERVDFSKVKKIEPDELECMRQTISARELQIRRVDVTMIGFPAETTLELMRVVDLTINAEGEVEIRQVDDYPRLSILKRGHHDEVRRAVAACGEGEVVVDLVFDPKTFLLVSAEAHGEHATSEQGRCVVAAVEPHVDTTDYYEPRTPEDSRLRCTFGVDSGPAGPFACKPTGPLAASAPKPVE